MATYNLLLIFLLKSVSGSSISDKVLGPVSTGRQWNSYAEDSSKSRFFPLFPIVRINNVACIAELAETIGTCFTRSQCRNARGFVSGSCASGFGVCCVVTAKCDSIVSQNNTAFQSRDFPYPMTPSGTGLEICTVKVQKPSAEVCQLHLEFTSLELATANPNGLCYTDRFTINGVTSAPSNLCGNLTGQHLYLDFGSSDRISISIILDAAANRNERIWNIKMKYIECNSLVRAPQGCLQYYMSASEEVRILGYPMVPHLANLDYTICVRNEDDSGSITWAPCSETSDSRLGPPNNFAMTGNIATRTSGTLCNEDYVLIMTDDAKANDRYCGTSLGDSRMKPELIRSIAHPFIMRVKTDESESVTDVDNNGFCLVYRQEPPSRNRRG